MYISGPPAKKFSQEVAEAAATSLGPTEQEAKKVMAALAYAGFPLMVIPYVLGQAYHETNAFKSNAYLKDNNAAGIKFLNKSYQKASRGIRSSEKDNYAHYANLNDWAKDLKRVLSFGARPIDATSDVDFVERLAKNHFFDTTKPNAKNNYVHGIRRAGIVKNLADDVRSTLPVPPGVDPKALIHPKAFSLLDIPTWAKWVIGILGGIIVVKAIQK